MSPALNRYWALRRVGWGAVLCGFAGCSAGYPPMETDTVAEKTAQSKHERTARDVSPETEDLEAELFLTDAGKVLVRSLPAHGGVEHMVGTFPLKSYPT